LTISVVIPVYNEEHVLAHTISKLTAFLEIHFPGTHKIVIANNASTDGTLNIARQLAATHSRVKVLHLDEKGRGRAVKCAWSQSQADILSYMDVDLSADLAAFPELIRPLATGECDISIGSRLLKPELTNRSMRRETISRGCNRQRGRSGGKPFPYPLVSRDQIRPPAAAFALPLASDLLALMVRCPPYED